jgi:hypothetical protein
MSLIWGSSCMVVANNPKMEPITALAMATYRLILTLDIPLNDFSQMNTAGTVESREKAGRQ